MSWAFWNTYADEAWAALTLDWEKPAATAVIDFTALQAALDQIGKVA
jgi:hypothetical protein